MAVNLKKNGDALRAAWKDVLDIKTPTNWAVFGYEGQTNDLEVVGTGDGGVEEMAEELNSGKVMYAFLKVDDPKTTLPKNVLINWQGEGANIVRKGTCANHVRDVSNFFSGAHVTLNARNDEEVEPQIIIEKVAKSSGSSYSFNTRTEVIESQKPVGTNYQRVNPVQEINAQERNQFWLREEQEERKRVEEERKRRESERLKLEQELKRREEVESAGRDVIDEQRNETINRLREAEKEAIVKENDRKMLLENERLERELIQEKVSSDAQMKKERSQEVQQIIGKNTSNVRSIFEQNTSAGQMLSPTKRGDNEIRSPNKIDTSKFEYEPELIQSGKTIEPEMENVNDSDDQDQFSTIKRSPKSPNDVVNSENIKNSEIHGNKVRSSEKSVLQEEITVAKLPPIVTEQQMVDEILGADLGSDYGLRARALYDYQAADDTEITFDPGDIISHIDQIDEGWWQGLGPDGTFGLFPANYVEVIF